LYRCLNRDDDAEVPWEWWVGRLCEEFHCLPSAALREWERVPWGTLETIVEFRAFAAAKQAYEAADTAEKVRALPNDPMIDRVREFEFEDVAAQRNG
jgi:hypothetical protein